MTRACALAFCVTTLVACEPSNAKRAAPIPASARSSAQAPSSTPAASSAPAAPSAAVKPARPRLFAKSRSVFIRPQPDASRDWIGFLWTGAAVELKSEIPRKGPGCGAFYAIEPEGYVCVDGQHATLDETDPVYRALLPYAAKTDSPWLHRYGESLGLARFFSTPTPGLQRQQEPELGAHLQELARARAGDTTALSGVDLTLPETAGFEFPHLPRGVFETRTLLSHLSTVAYSTEVTFGERGFLLTADYAWVPKDRVKPYPIVTFQGVELGSGATLPLAFIRKDGRAKYVRADDGTFSATNATFPRLSHLKLSGKSERFRGQRYFETKEPSAWIRELDAVIPEPRTKTPWGAALGAVDTSGRAPKGRGTWIEVSIEGGWLLAFEGTRPVYATLVSPGSGGVAGPEQDPLQSNATPVGTYPISGKLVTATMEAPGDLVHSDVPFVQNIIKPYALHGAYWHDNWGNLQSGGCVNLAPIDAKWLFDFTEPQVPKGWHAVRWQPSRPTTIVILHR